MKSRLTFSILFFSLNISLFSQDAELCAPYALSVFGGNQENVISWAEPFGGIGCGNYLIDGMPYSHLGTNTGAGNNWDLVGGDNEDVAYTLNIYEQTTVDITLCSENTNYDTKLEIFTLNDDGCDSSNATSTGNYNDDDFTCDFNTLQSSLLGVTLQPGQYYVVVDGFGTSNGNYEISVNVSTNRSHDADRNNVRNVWVNEELKMIELGFSQSIIDTFEAKAFDPNRYKLANNVLRDVPQACGTFNCYRVYDAETNVVLTCTEELSFTHGGLTNGTEYCYYITALYDDGESEISQTVCATPGFFEPAPPTNVYAEVWDEQISIYWTDPEVNNLGIPYYESFDENGLSDLWLVDGDNWAYEPFFGNPEPSFEFYYWPVIEDYNQSLYAPEVPLGDIEEVTIEFDLHLRNFNTETVEYLAVEYRTGEDNEWNLLEDFDNSLGDIDYETYSFDVSNLSDNIQVRFRCHGSTTNALWEWRIDNFSVTSDGRDSRNEYDFLGYNVYVDGILNNSTILDTTGYTVYELSNEIEYTLGVTSVYEGAVGESNYESEIVAVTAQPIYVYGDVTGIISDPNGSPLAGAIVSVGSASDTTGNDGLYMVRNLDVGINTVVVRMEGFYSATVEVEILAQADPTQQNFVIYPDMPFPGGLHATPLDEQVFLEWNTPGASSANNIGCGDYLIDMMPYSHIGTNIGMGDDWNVTFGDNEDVAYTLNVSEETTYDFTLCSQNTTYDTKLEIFTMNGDGCDSSNALSTGNYNDDSPFGTCEFSSLQSSLFGVFLEPGQYYVVVDGFGTSNGNYELTINTVENRSSTVTNNHISSAWPTEELKMIEQGFSRDEIDLYAADVILYEKKTSSVFAVNSVANNREDVLLEYRVYAIDEDGIETFIVATEDTFATIEASPNYLEYCYNVSAYWETEDYGQLESTKSNEACTVPYTLGDSDFDNDTDINDVLTVVDFILEMEYPTEDEFRNVDVNMDGNINIADIVMMIDIIFGTSTARLIDFDPNEIAYVDLKSDYSHSTLNLEIEYNGPIRGMEFELNYDSDLIDIQTPYLIDFQGNVMISSNMINEETKKVIVSDMKGGTIKPNGKAYLSIPVEFKGSNYDIGQVQIDNINVAGFAGDLIDYVARSTTSEVKLIPHNFSLQQNFPNPFNPSTEIRFDLPEEGHVELSVFNMQGQKVKTLESSKMTPGYHAIVWNGTNDTGSRVSTGMYFYSIQTNKFKAVKKMLFLK